MPGNTGVRFILKGGDLFGLETSTLAGVTFGGGSLTSGFLCIVRIIYSTRSAVASSLKVVDLTSQS